MAAEKPKPCPFCGAEPISERSRGNPNLWRIECRDDSCMVGPEVVVDTDAAGGVTRELLSAEAIRRWNTRRGEGGR